MAGRGLNPIHPFQAVPAIISRLAQGATGSLKFYIIKNRYYVWKYVGKSVSIRWRNNRSIIASKNHLGWL